jgi:hypothetical protein
VAELPGHAEDAEDERGQGERPVRGGDELAQGVVAQRRLPGPAGEHQHQGDQAGGAGGGQADQDADGRHGASPR